MMNRLEACVMGFMVMMSVILYMLVVIKEECIPVDSLIYRDDIEDKELNEIVSGMYVVKTGIYYSITQSFGKKYFCHWSLLIVTKGEKGRGGGNMFIISPTGHGSVNIHKVLKEYIYRDGRYTFIKGGSLGKYILCSKRIDLNYDVTVKEVIDEMKKTNKNIKYLPFSMNCQYVVSYVLSLYVTDGMDGMDGGKLPNVSSIESFKRVLNDFMFGYKF